MPYATQADMIARYGLPRLVALTDVGTPQTGELNTTLLQARLDDAIGEIDGYLAGRYALPLATVPAMLRACAIDITWLLLLGATADEAALRNAEAKRKFLALVAKGDVALFAPEAAPATAGIGPVLFETGSKVMGREDSESSA